MKSPPAWISCGGQAIAVPQVLSSAVGCQLHSHGPLDWLGGTVTILV